MKKLSKITESIWSDMQDRSAGDVVRKEDDINLMSGEDFCDYLNANYICESNQKIEYNEISKRITISILNKVMYFDYSIIYNYKNNTISMNDEVESFCPELCKKIKENFKVDKEYVSSTYTKFIISPSNGSECTNRFFVDVLDFIIENGDKNILLLKKKHINESIWSDMQDRSAGEITRKEDDINCLDMLGLLDYIQKKYEFNKEIMTLSSSIGIPLFSYKSNIIYLIISFTYSQDRIYDVYSRVIYDSQLKNSISSILKQKYLTKISKENTMSKYFGRYVALISTKPKKGDIDNRFVIDVIDTYIDIMNTFKNIDKHIKRK